jgi:hypothetical protein
MSTFMPMSFNIFKSVFSKPHENKLDFSRFDLISKLPYAPYYNEYKFITTIHKTSDIPQSGLYFNKQIGCADDMVYQTSQEFNNPDIKNRVEYKALGFENHLQNAMMQASANPISAKAKYIVFTANGLGVKYNNPVIGVFENTHPDVDPNMRIEYEIYNTVNGK